MAVSVLNKGDDKSSNIDRDENKETASSDDDATRIKDIVLKKEEEFRFEVETSSLLRITLVSGSAECFGLELAIDKTYAFQGPIQSAIFTWYGCTVKIQGNVKVAYTSDESTMCSYVNIHAQLDDRRLQAHTLKRAGPKILVAGPVDSGKSTLCRILLNYAIREGRKPTFVDLDVGQNSLSVPGTLSATPLDRNCLSVEESFILTTPLIYNFAHLTPKENVEFYTLLVNQLAAAVSKRMRHDDAVNAAGCIINTCGWVDGDGYSVLKHCIEAFEVDVVLVLGQDRLYSELKREVGKEDDGQQQHLTVLKLDRSGGVVPRGSSTRRKEHMRSIREYFYGKMSIETGLHILSPSVLELPFDQVHVYRIVDMKAIDVILPVGHKATERLQLLKVEIDMDMCHSIASVLVRESTAIASTQEEEDHSENVLKATSAGFLYVKEVDLEKRILKLLAPCPGDLPSNTLLVGSIKWME